MNALDMKELYESSKKEALKTDTDFKIGKDNKFTIADNGYYVYGVQTVFSYGVCLTLEQADDLLFSLSIFKTNVRIKNKNPHLNKKAIKSVLDVAISLYTPEQVLESFGRLFPKFDIVVTEPE